MVLSFYNILEFATVGFQLSLAMFNPWLGGLKVLDHPLIPMTHSTEPSLLSSGCECCIFKRSLFRLFESFVKNAKLEDTCIYMHIRYRRYIQFKLSWNSIRLHYTKHENDMQCHWKNTHTHTYTHTHTLTHAHTHHIIYLVIILLGYIK